MTHKTPDRWPTFRRCLPVIRLAILVSVSFCVMAFTHELGHLMGGQLGGATLQSGNLWPWRLPYTIFSPDPRPLITLWSGPLVGVLLPLIVALGIGHRWLWFIADFCLLANGVYIAAGWISRDSYLDTIRLLDNGASPVTLIAFCATTIGFGYGRFRARVREILSPAGTLRG